MSDDKVDSCYSLALASSALDPTTDGDKFKEYYQLANRLVDAADKDLMAEVALSLAIDVAYYRLKYGATPMHETCALLRSEITDEVVAQLAVAMGYLVVVLATTAYEAAPGDVKLN